MNKQTMSIHRALAELKSYDDRITRSTEQNFVIANKKSNDKIAGKTIEECKQQIKGGFASYYALTENQRRIKAAVVLSNAITKVKIGGIEYTVAEAIERKAKLHHDESFLMKLKQQFNTQNKKVEDENATLPEKLESYFQSILGEKDKRTVEDISAHTKAFEDRNKYELIDPSDIAKQIEKLEESITGFKTEVDYVLSESNATTFIDVEFVD
jgi:predicted ATP-grasp superfamily ATP-dependent carboligase